MTDEQAIEQLRAKGYEISAVPTTFTNDHNDHHTKLEKRIDDLEARSGLMSKSWFNRVFTTWVYFLIAQVMIGLVVLFLGMIFGLLG